MTIAWGTRNLHANLKVKGLPDMTQLPIRLGFVYAHHPALYERFRKPIALGVVQRWTDTGDMAGPDNALWCTRWFAWFGCIIAPHAGFFL